MGANAKLQSYGIKFDRAAQQKLREVEPSRAVEILEDLLSKLDKGDYIAKPSAFVMKALVSFPKKRNEPIADTALAMFPRVLASLDDDVVRRLRALDPERAVEILQDLASTSDVRNPSAFAMRALKSHPESRKKEKKQQDEGNDADISHLRLPPPPDKKEVPETTKGQLKPPPPQNLPPNKNIYVEGL